MDRARATRISKLLSFALRHEPSALDLKLDPAGWADVDHLLRGLATRGETVDAEDLEEIVASSDKQRFALSADGGSIRANQGHSLAVDLGLASKVPPEVLFHGTAEAFVASIRREGLLRRARTHVHLSADEETARIVARRRRGQIAILCVRALSFHEAGGTFFQSANGVWLTDHVPSAFLVH